MIASSAGSAVSATPSSNARPSTTLSRLGPVGGERQREAAAGERQRGAAHVLRGADLQHRPHEAQLVDLEAAAEQGQRLEPEIQPVDPQGALGRRLRARQGGARQGQRRPWQQLEVDPALDRHRLPGQRLSLLGELRAIVVPGHQPRQQRHASAERGDEQERESDGDSQGRHLPMVYGARAGAKL